MTPLRPAVKTLQSKLTRIAASGDANALSTGEVKKALAQGLVSKAERDLLTRALSDGRPDVASVAATLNGYVEAFQQADVNHDGRISGAERQRAESAYEQWIRIATNPRSTAEQREAAFKQTIRSTVIKQNGETVQIPESSVGALLDKLMFVQH